MARFTLLARLFLGVVLLAAIATGAVRLTAGETPKSIRVIYTDDMVGNWQPCG